MRSRYDEAVTAASRGASRIVIASFEGIARDATTRYLDIDEKLAEARRAWKATAQPVLVAARDLAVKGMWVEALKMYEQARDIDPTVPVSVEVGNVELAKLTAGQDACKRGKQTISYNNSQGMEFFRRALALLPSDDPCYQDAKRYVDGVAR